MKFLVFIFFTLLSFQIKGNTPPLLDLNSGIEKTEEINNSVSQRLTAIIEGVEATTALQRKNSGRIRYLNKTIAFQPTFFTSYSNFSVDQLVQTFTVETFPDSVPLHLRYCSFLV